MLLQFAAHAHADRERDASARPLAALLVTQPVHQFPIPARRVPAEEVLVHGRRQRLKRPPSDRQQRRVRRHVAVTKFVRHHQVHLRPQRQHRLISLAALIRRPRFPLPALDDRRVHIDGGDPLIRTAASDLLHQILIHLRQTPQWRTLVGDITHLSGGQLALRLPQLLLVVKLIEKLPRGFRRRHLMPQHLAQSLVFPQPVEIFQAFSA